MPREKKQVLKKRADGRYACRSGNQLFYSSVSSDDALAQRKAYREELKRGRIMSYFVKDYARNWLDRAFPNISPSSTPPSSTEPTAAMNDTPSNAKKNGSSEKITVSTKMKKTIMKNGLKISVMNKY
jgi:patatin-like phospholipase/acyl hydrolase